MRSAVSIAIVLTPLTIGCKLTSQEANPAWLADFQRADTLLVRNGDTQRIVADVTYLRRLEQIYRTSHWKPYVGTLPANLDRQQIILIADGRTLRRFSLIGELWETGSYTEVRTAELSPTDRGWFTALFQDL